jgi:hypothetical protein
MTPRAMPSKYLRIVFVVLTCVIASCQEQRNANLPGETIVGNAVQKLEIGRDVELGRVSWATRLDNGNFAVADAYARAFLVFDSLGKHVRTVGRRGAGPGEFQDLAWIGQCERGKLYAFDGLQFEFEIFDTSGVSVRQLGVPRSSKIRCRDGVIVALLMPSNLKMPDPKQPRRLINTDIEVLSLKGDVIARIDDVPVGEFGPLARVADVAITEGSIWYGSSDSAALTRFSYKGRRQGVVAFAEHPRLATDAHMQADIENQVRGFTDEATKERSRSILSKFRKPDRLPAFRSFTADDQGSLWINDTFPGDSVTTLLKLTKNGTIEARVTVPGQLRIFEVQNGLILGGTEVDGVPILAVYDTRHLIRVR